ncbi:MAG TPA: replication-associated recombination protein A [Campylobacterales bacterium]|nr:replication-associated recombination protein A [Campylobacterales bacterium]
MSLAQILRPSSLEDFLGQKHLLGAEAPFRRLIEAGSIPHSFFFGPPGTGKTSLARIVAAKMEANFFEFNATSVKIDDIRKAVDANKNSFTKPLIFIDEVHRLSKTQQEVLLPIMENKFALIIGASTENPFFSLTGGIRSRSMLFEFFSLTDDDLREALAKGLQSLGKKADEDAAEYLVRSSSGDARAMLTLLEFAAKLEDRVTLDTLKKLRPQALTDGAGESETHYNLASALIKSVRGSDENAAVYYLARLLAGGEEPRFVARRLAVLAAEDIGNANPNALQLANAAFSLVEKIGMPESRIILSQLTIYLACCPKSNSAYMAIDDALALVEGGEIQPVPPHLKDAHFAGAKSLGRGVGYKYPHDFGGWAEQRYTQKPLDIVKLKDIGFEKTLKEWLGKIRVHLANYPA